MRLGPSGTPSPADRRARVAVGALFLANAAVFANLVPRYPEIKGALDLGNAAYGWAIAAYPAGAVAAGLAAGPLIRRAGSARVAVVGVVLTGLGVLAAGIAPSVTLFAVGLAVAGATDAITDVAQNAHGLRVQRRYGRSILNSFHALWSIGAVLGGAMGLLTAAGMGVALAVPTTPLTVLGLAAAGLGVATLVPAAMHQADELPGLRPGTGLAVVSWVMRLGFLLWPPVVGALAEATSLRAALVVVPVAGAVVTVLAGVLPRRTPRTPAHVRRVGPA